jgi:hypothetical protein
MSHHLFGIIGNVPKKVSDLTFPFERSRVVTVATFVAALIVTTRSLETSVSINPIGLPLLSLLMIIASLLRSFHAQNNSWDKRVLTA